MDRNIMPSTTGDRGFREIIHSRKLTHATQTNMEQHELTQNSMLSVFVEPTVRLGTNHDRVPCQAALIIQSVKMRGLKHMRFKPSS
jgi:hypothetical protein